MVQAILKRLAELLAATGTGTVPKAQFAAWSEYSLTGGGFNNGLGQLRSAALIATPANGTVTLSQAGFRIPTRPWCMLLQSPIAGG